MTYRDDTESVRAENARLRAEVASLRSTRWRRVAFLIGAVVGVGAFLAARRGGLRAEAACLAVQISFWLWISRKLPR